MAQHIRDLGSFESIQQVWTALPGGGMEGDYLTINGNPFAWNKYIRQWQNDTTVINNPARELQTHDGDMNIGNDARIGGNLVVIGNIINDSIKNGLSAFELAVKGGYQGTEEQWLNSLIGKSAYQIWLEQAGNAGKGIEYFLAWMKDTKEVKGPKYIEDEALIDTVNDRMTLFYVNNGTSYKVVFVDEQGYTHTLANRIGDITNYAGIYDVSADNELDGGILKTYGSLSEAITDIDDNAKKGGMTIKYIDSNSGNYVQYNLKATVFTDDVTQWEKINNADFVDTESVDFAVSDKLGYLIFKVFGGNFATKNFNSLFAPIVKNALSEAEFMVGDNDGNVVFQVKNGHVKTKYFDSSNIQTNKPHINVAIADFKADVYMIPCYGQSLSVNTSAGTSTFVGTEPLSYNKNLQNDNIQDMCAGTAEAFRLMADFYGITLPTNFKVIGCTGGAGGLSILQLSKGTTYYNNVLNNIRTAKTACENAGLSMCVPCFTWTQGEEEMRCGGDDTLYGSGNWNPFEYKTKLRQLIEDFNEDIKEITGQSCDVICISYQVASHLSYQRYPRIALQQAELASEYDKMVLAKIMYDVDYVREQGTGTNNYLEVHAPAKTYRNMGNLYGIAAFNTCILNLNPRWLHLLSHRLVGNKVILRFDVPYAPLVLDTDLVNQLPDGNYGFNIYNVDEESGEAGTITEAITRITQVRLIGNDEVELTLNRLPQQGERLTYGINGDYWQNITGKLVDATGEVDDNCTKAGREHGSRGCLRDSQPIINANEGSEYLHLYNWCEIFEIIF